MQRSKLQVTVECEEDQYYTNLNLQQITLFSDLLDNHMTILVAFFLLKIKADFRIVDHYILSLSGKLLLTINTRIQCEIVRQWHDAQ